MKIEIYKRGQGKYTRLGSWAAAMVITMFGAAELAKSLEGAGNPYIQFGIPAAVVLVVAMFVGWLINKRKPADFLIATEGEMRKVSWSSRKEVIGSTKVVIVTTFIMMGVLFAMDMTLTVLFGWLGIIG